MKIRVAEKDEYKKVRHFYHSMIDAMQTAEYKPGWEKEVYPSDTYLQAAIEKKELFVGMVNDEIVSAMIVNHDGNESYSNARWLTEAAPEETIVIHALGVHPNYSRRGFAKELVSEVIAAARASSQKVVRLDVLEGNIPAEKLYTGMGFVYVDTIQMYYDDTGWAPFKLYEYPLV